ncbi:MAG: GNAT family N-acetyltransferase [Acidobacteria bacterium]|nr:GNAT family N-acetyltransferase [Acidobacteriota bacterium]
MNMQSVITASPRSSHLTQRVPIKSPGVESLADAQKAEILTFLSQRPLHTVYLAGFILDNGVVSPLNRGSFYGYRNSEGLLEGVALIGHATLFEIRSDEALVAFASLAQKSSRTHMLLGEMEKVENFWNLYSAGGQAPRLMCRELLFEQSFPVEVKEPVQGLRRATLRDLEMLLPVQAAMAFEESGINPMEKDPSGFRLRCARRIEQGRVWVLIENGRLIFKADIMSDTPEVIYMEGIYIAPEDRGCGIGRRCLSQLTRNLLARTKTVSLLVNEQNERASSFYLQAGFKLRAHYDTIFLQQAAA